MKDEDRTILRGIVKADEAYVGGKPRGRGGTTKTPVKGSVERGGKLIAKMVDSVPTDSVTEFIFLNVSTRQSKP